MKYEMMHGVRLGEYDMWNWCLEIFLKKYEKRALKFIV